MATRIPLRCVAAYTAPIEPTPSNRSREYLSRRSQVPTRCRARSVRVSKWSGKWVATESNPCWRGESLLCQLVVSGFDGWSFVSMMMHDLPDSTVTVENVRHVHRRASERRGGSEEPRRVRDVAIDEDPNVANLRSPLALLA